MDGTGEARIYPIRGRAKRVAKNFMVCDDGVLVFSVRSCFEG
jgi:hypothetical protein